MMTVIQIHLPTMSDTPSRKEQTHAHIVRTASRAIRRQGYGGIGVADIMKEAGLTRQDAPVRRAATRRMKEVIDLLARQLPGWAAGEDRDKALAVYCSLVGALTIARAVDDPEMSKAVRDAARRAIHQQIG
jgi:hypothetical protein